METKNSGSCTFNMNIAHSVINCPDSGSAAAPQDIIPSAAPPSTRDQEDDDTTAANAQIQQSHSHLSSPPLSAPGEQECFKPTSKVVCHLSRSSQAPSANQGCGQDLRNSDKK